MGIEAELISSSFPPPPPYPSIRKPSLGQAPGDTPRLPGCTKFVTVTAFPGLLMSC